MSAFDEYIKMKPESWRGGYSEAVLEDCWNAAIKYAEVQKPSHTTASMPCPQCVGFGVIPPLVNYCKACGRKLPEHGARC